MDVIGAIYPKIYRHIQRFFGITNADIPHGTRGLLAQKDNLSNVCDNLKKANK